MTGFRSHDDSDPPLGVNDVLFEAVRIGNSVKMSAIDVRTNTEVSIVGAASMNPFSLKMNALRKLRAVLAKRAAS